MKNTIKFFASVIILALLASTHLCAAEAPPAKGPINVKMRALQDSLEQLWQDAASYKKLATKQGLKAYGDSLRNFVYLSKSVAVNHANLQNTTNAPLDPSLEVIAGQFSEQTTRALHFFEKGEVTTSRNLILNMSGYCITCHTASNRGPSFSDKILAGYMKEMSAYERAEFLAATRYFDGALDEYKKVIADPKAVRTLEWINSVRHSVAIAIRFKEQPELALAIIKQASQVTGVPAYFQRDAAAWKKALESWMQEKTVSAKNEQEDFDRVAKLFEQAKLHRDYPADQGADMDFLRATAAAHAYLKNNPQGKFQADALLLLGQGYQSLMDFNIWPLHTVYFEACVRKSPHSPIAQKCYENYEEAIYLGYSGSSGTFIPEDEHKKLKELEKIAQ